MRVRDAPPSAPLTIHLLGRFMVYVSGHPLPEAAIRGRKARSLLKLLALQRHFQMVRDQAMEALWPALDATAAAAQLYKALHHIRKALALQTDEATEWIEITDDLVRLVPPGGRIQISDIVLSKPVSDKSKADPQLWAECIVGAEPEDVYLEIVRSAGFENVVVIDRLDYFAKSANESTRSAARGLGAHTIVLTGRKA